MKVGCQTQTSSRDPYDLSLRRAVLGPNCYLDAYGNEDKDPQHYWYNLKSSVCLLFTNRHPSLSKKPLAPKLLPSLTFELDPTHDISTLLGAYMPGNQYQFLSVLAMTISMSNSDAVRTKAKHHPNVRNIFDFKFIFFK